jgi:hypothetical protein
VNNEFVPNSILADRIAYLEKTVSNLITLVDRLTECVSKIEQRKNMRAPTAVPPSEYDKV